VWLHLLAVAALLKYLPDGWFKTVVKLWGAGAVVALVVITLPFMVATDPHRHLSPVGPGRG
jgi:ABC-type molybdate transport system permease subunit